MNSLKPTIFSSMLIRNEVIYYYGLFTLPELDSKPEGYIVMCRRFNIGSDPDLDPCTESFPNCYCTYFRDRSVADPGFSRGGGVNPPGGA